MGERLCRCGKQLTADQKAYCSKPCRVEGMRAAKAAKHDKGDDWYQPESYTGTATIVVDPPASIGDWRRPQQDREAMQSYHRRPPGWA